MRRRPPSRPARWYAACAAARTALDAVEAALSDAERALQDLEGVRQEYEDWKDNLPENLANSALGEKLEAVAGLDISGGIDEVRTAVESVIGVIDEAEGVDLPRGFGND